MTVIGLTGLAGAGKSTLAQILVEDHGFTRLSFAGPLKKMLRTLDPIIGEQYGETVRLSEVFEVHSEDQLKRIPVWGDEYRRLMQVLGTECIRAEMDDFWTVLASNQVEDLDKDYVFDDVRFPNEAALVKYYNVDGLWNIYRPGTEAGSHASEQLAGKLGETLWLGNDGELDKLRHSATMALEEMRASA